ncbi:uncharacterized protein TEOVI_000418000 [Trypanosoma equiperdum]|uniref:Uncharacterized protein n=2 Tax=Trypanozoon TaxID=39700 RepID=A0A1G4IJU8_TRYEQ|nr:hypothetical protein DPX39_100080000 [Trypanosoma brucei equiperdum]SCU72603.1 hypothetical protein, conserved [Trypanosoma equiperdum]
MLGITPQPCGSNSDSDGDGAGQELLMASLDYELRVKALRNEAYRQALSEVAGEVYESVYTKTFCEAMRKHRTEWGITPL